MSDNQGQSEPSMEEILASIRRIISEEDAEEGKPAAAAAAPPEEVEEEDDDVLELTEMDAVQDEEPEEEPAEEPETVLDLDEADALPDENEPSDAAAPAAVAAEAAIAELEVEAEAAASGPVRETGMGRALREGLVSASTAAATTAALSEMTRRRRVPPGLGAPTGGESLEAFVARLLEPHLQAWLEDNLPQLVERVVRDEVRRLARRAEDD
ncbi:hypothetical protein SAMN06265365_10515 [Tistlia consotensis]|uniref:DUF2497 domain-containing protein n=1 Tax=Tistlia consotensis USBA 355 TaxID=560819 RepID=A0A1Y6BJW4_9PROT|nr:DUF2497 domain-containing protein [Tistlia consotensis]SMF14655.1 hypothetical protein SAMN05428998_105284 [Tistlia consotensis USBA 355]SNR49367.1 hypothetical protein SAMN06265365_10515 [Tistlia consotensis]